MTCVNCKSQLSCGCQQRIAADGKKVCSNCVTKYNNSVKSTGQQPAATSPATPVINSIKVNR